MRQALTALMISTALCHADPALDSALDAAVPDLQKWASICHVTGTAEKPSFEWHDYRSSADHTDFWPASTIKLYAAIAALELLHEKGQPLDTIASFQHQDSAGIWHLDCARTVPEMLSEVFRRSSNEDYTLLLRLTGIDRINTQFLTPERGFPHSALMRGYVKERPWGYLREEPQRIHLSSASGTKPSVIQHHWSGRFYAEERGCTVIDAKTGNVTSARELTDTLRRLLFHDQIPETERFKLSSEQVNALLHGSAGFTGLETTNPDSGPSSWSAKMQAYFPKARFYHKCGLISDHAMDLACLDDRANGGPCCLWLLAVKAGHATKPIDGEKRVAQMADALADWLKHH
jgi:Beta-lactamase enzyme family